MQKNVVPFSAWLIAARLFGQYVAARTCSAKTCSARTCSARPVWPVRFGQRRFGQYVSANTFSSGDGSGHRSKGRSCLVDRSRRSGHMFSDRSAQVCWQVGRIGRSAGLAGRQAWKVIKADRSAGLAGRQDWQVGSVGRSAGYMTHDVSCKE